MTDFTPTPSEDAVDDAKERWREETDTFGRVYDVVLGTTEPTAASEIAAIADCSPNAAKKHLDRLAEMGIVRASRQHPPARYERDDGYLEWQEASRIARNLDVEDIIERVRRLEEEREAFADRFGTNDPSTVSVLDGGDHDAVHDRMTAVSEWRGIDHEIRLYELARTLAENDGHLLPA